ncbi:energy transducer TonB [Lacisediminimonas profundi]|uniref:energy transducer TonB n=1 Tax=Lacisediminimonas profundi TaxID=2603856 RepID=UPI00124B3610|nr:energy transducer TonB [Lacisediminimonas profundi]
MNISLPSRTGLLALITVTHIAILWMLATRMAAPDATAPVPLPAVMVAMLAPSPAVARPEPPQPKAPIPTIKPQPAPNPKQETPRPALAEKAPAAAPTSATAASPAVSAATAAAAEPSPPPAQSATAAAGAPVSAQPQLTPPRYNAAYLSNPVPVYPAMLRRAGEEGRVVLRVLVTAEGNAGEVQVFKPAGSPLFNEAAMTAVRKWRFVPARRGDVAVAEWVQVPIEFKLN